MSNLVTEFRILGPRLGGFILSVLLSLAVLIGSIVGSLHSSGGGGSSEIPKKPEPEFKVECLPGVQLMYVTIPNLGVTGLEEEKFKDRWEGEINGVPLGSIKAGDKGAPNAVAFPADGNREYKFSGKYKVDDVTYSFWGNGTLASPCKPFR